MLKRLMILLAVAAVAAMAGARGSSERGSSGQNGPAGSGAGGAGTGAEAQASADAATERPTAVETVRVAYKETAAEQTAKTSFEITTTGPEKDPENSGQPAPTSMTMTGRGVVDFSGTRSALNMRMPGMGTMEVRQIENVS